MEGAWRFGMLELAPSSHFERPNQSVSCPPPLRYYLSELHVALRQ